MKKHLYICFILLTVLLKGQITFNGYYKNGYNNYFSTHIFPQTDSSNIFLNYVQDSLTGRQDLNFFKLDKTGALVQKKSINASVTCLTYINSFNDAIEISNSSLLTTSATYTNANNNTTLIFTKVNKSTLDSVKVKFFDDNVYGYAVSNFVKLGSNKYYVIGNKWTLTGQYYQWPVVFQMDSNLNINNTFTISNSINLMTTNAVLHPITKKLLLAGTITYGVNKVNVGLIEADTFGVVTNSVIIPYADIQGISQLKYCPFDDSYVFGGALRTSKVGNASLMRIQFTKVNTNNLSVIWSKTYGQSSQLNDFASITINTDGSIVGCGRYADSTLNQNQWDAAGVLLKVGVNGDSLWMRRYNNYQNPPNPSNYFEAFYGVERAKDGGYIACGGIMNQPKSKAWVIKTDSMGCVAVGCGGLINGTYTATTDITEYAAKEGEFTLYPNPAHDKLMIERLSTTSSDAVGIQVLTVLGQVVLETPLTHLPAQLDISTLPSGIYLLKLRTPNQREHIIKFIKE